LCPKGWPMMQCTRVGKLMHNYVIHQLYRQLHEEKIKRDVLILIAATPTTTHLLDTYTAIVIALQLRKICETLWQKYLRLLPQGSDTCFFRYVLYILVFPVSIVANRNRTGGNTRSGYGKPILRYVLQRVRFADLH